MKQQIEGATKAGPLDIDNPLLDHIWLPWDRRTLQLWDSGKFGIDCSLYGSTLRGFATTEYSWAIPTNEALSTILSLGHNIVELGSGLGYWASLLAAAGGNVTAVDNARNSNDRYFPQTVNQDGAAYLQEHEGAPDATLFICWGIPTDFNEALAAFRGEYLAVVGEENGCTWWPEWHLDDSDDDANQAKRQWRLIRTVVIPKWSCIHVYLAIFQRDEADQKQEPTADAIGKLALKDDVTSYKMHMVASHPLRGRHVQPDSLQEVWIASNQDSAFTHPQSNSVATCTAMQLGCSLMRHQ